ncbi:DNA-processing protein DprA [Salirhabdus salicampi]|uniref:DNA-processing protein DprA n=1 Tax=Salirhabdus salicampi TaxID=476102 RepID=UPI0020C26E56|nr:DNA-processing protein DprA [Salirhabdus salicampi]MCP8616534.1 DNA-processing protein DprA [Salirhabdus salicampi]
MVLETDIRICHLHRIQGVGRKMIRTWLKLDPNLSNIYQFSVEDLQQLFHLPKVNASVIHNGIHNHHIRKQVEKDINNYGVITFRNPIYPTLLKEIPDPPVLLYLKGDAQLLKRTPHFSIVGTRHPSKQGLKKVEHFVRPLAQHGWTIVSGLAQGMDSYAHQVTMKYNGKTIAVLGHGFHYIYPRQHEGLFREIGKNHLLLSEYPPDTPPKRWQFPERNRIVSGLSFGTLIVEAKEKSGTFITAECALEQGRDLFAVPDSIFSEYSRGCHQLIQEGANLVDDPRQLLEYWENEKYRWDIGENGCQFVKDYDSF